MLKKYRSSDMGFYFEKTAKKVRIMRNDAMTGHRQIYSSMDVVAPGVLTGLAPTDRVWVGYRGRSNGRDYEEDRYES